MKINLYSTFELFKTLNTVLHDEFLQFSSQKQMKKQERERVPRNNVNRVAKRKIEALGDSIPKKLKNQHWVSSVKQLLNCINRTLFVSAWTKNNDRILYSTPIKVKVKMHLNLFWQTALEWFTSPVKKKNVLKNSSTDLVQVHVPNRNTQSMCTGSASVYIKLKSACFKNPCTYRKSK